MNTINLPNDEARRGALAAFQALLMLKANAENNGNCGDEAGDFFAWRYNAATALADALGPMTIWPDSRQPATWCSCTTDEHAAPRLIPEKPVSFTGLARHPNEGRR